MFYIIHTTEGPFMVVTIDMLCQLIETAYECIVWVEATDNRPEIR